MSSISYFVTYLILVAGGGFIEVVLSKIYFRIIKSNYKQHHFFFSKYIFLLLAPILAFLYAVIRLGYSPVKVFLIFAIAGTVLEGLTGFSYHMVVGQRLWTYHRYAIRGYTSLLSVPLWGALGILTWLLAKAF